MAESENEIITKAMAEYADYIASGGSGKFVLSQPAVQELSRLSRLLWQKRQTSSLTQSEKSLLRQIDEFTQKTMDFNREPRAAGIAPSGSPVYDMGRQKKLEEPDDGREVAIPRISNQMAEDIIRQINEQFEKKVVNEVREERTAADKPDPRSFPEEESAEEAVEGPSGTNFRGYLTALKAERPEVPFADRDSHVDLSKLADRRG